MSNVLFENEHYEIFVSLDESSYSVINKQTRVTEFSDPKLAFCLEWARMNNEFIVNFFDHPKHKADLVLN